MRDDRNVPRPLVPSFDEARGRSKGGTRRRTTLTIAAARDYGKGADRDAKEELSSIVVGGTLDAGLWTLGRQEHSSGAEEPETRDQSPSVCDQPISVAVRL